MDTSSVDEIQEFMEESIKGLYTISECIVVLYNNMPWYTLHMKEYINL